jgi:preprotein translocase subunit SecA
MMKVEESMPVNHPLLSKTIEMSQKKVESYNFDARKSLLDYDNVLNKQREVIYAERDKVLAGVDLADEVHEFIREQAETTAQRVVQAHRGDETDTGEVNNEFINEEAETTAQRVVQAHRGDEADIGRVYNDLVLDAFGRPVAMTLEELTELLERRDAEQQLTTTIRDRAEAIYREKYDRYGESTMHQIEHYFFLRTIDSAWRDHLLQMDDLKDGIGLRAYGQKDPVIEYQTEGYGLFNELMDQIKHDVTRALFTFELQPAQPEKKRDRS